MVDTVYKCRHCREIYTLHEDAEKCEGTHLDHTDISIIDVYYGAEVHDSGFPGIITIWQNGDKNVVAKYYLDDDRVQFRG